MAGAGRPESGDLEACCCPCHHQVVLRQADLRPQLDWGVLPAVPRILYDVEGKAVQTLNRRKGEGATTHAGHAAPGSLYVTPTSGLALQPGLDRGHAGNEAHHHTGPALSWQWRLGSQGGDDPIAVRVVEDKWAFSCIRRHQKMRGSYGKRWTTLPSLNSGNRSTGTTATTTC